MKTVSITDLSHYKTKCQTTCVCQLSAWLNTQHKAKREKHEIFRLPSLEGFEGRERAHRCQQSVSSCHCKTPINFPYTRKCRLHAGAKVSKKWHGRKKSTASRIFFAMQKPWLAKVVRRINEWAHSGWNGNEMTWKNPHAQLAPNEPMNQWINEPTGEWTSETVNQWINEYVN